MKQIPSQDFLEFDQIRDGIIILKNKSLRAVLMVSSLNFALKSEEEQAAIIYQFQSFLNSLDFPCQILVHSRRLNMVGYLDKLKEIENKEKNELLKTQISEYHKFVENIISQGSIMQKSFYAVVPFALGEVRKTKNNKKGRAGLPKINKPLTESEFKRAKIQLLQRVEFVALGLKRAGLQSIPLNTLENIELLWGLYHPLEAERGYHPDIPPELFE